MALRALSLLLTASFLAAVAGSITVAAGQDPPRHMEEVTPPAHHVYFRAKGMWGYSDAAGEYALATDGAALLVIDVTDPSTPVIASRVTGGRDLKEVKTYKHYAICANQSGPVQIVDLSDPYHAYTAALYSSGSIPGAHNVWVDDDGFAYLALQGSGTSDLRILDLSDPLHPVERGHWRHPNQSGFVACHDVYVRDNLCYASWFGGGLVILDVTDKDAPSLVLNAVYPQSHTHNAWPTRDGRHVATTDEMSGGHLRIWSIGQGFAQQVAEYATREPAIIHNVHMKGDRAYIAYYSAGVRVLDMANPLAPREIGAFDTNESAHSAFVGCWSVYPYTPSGLIYASDIQNGLYVLRFFDETAGVARGTVHVEGAEAMRIDGAEIKFTEAEIRVVTDVTGFFQAKLPPGRHKARVRHPDFESQVVTIDVAAEQFTTQTMRLKPLATGLHFVGTPGPPSELGDRRLQFEAQVRGGGDRAAVNLRYRAGASGDFQRVRLERVASDSERYRGVVPELMSGTLVQYYFEAHGPTAAFALVPEEAPSRLLNYTVGDLDWVPVYANDFETDTGGFVVGASEDRGVSGIWERARPVQTPSDSSYQDVRLAQPDADVSPEGEGYCFMTELGRPGSSPGESRVDGRTTLTSPVVDLRGARAARLRAAIWFVNDLFGGLWQDPFLVQATTDGGGTWRTLAAIRQPAVGWQPLTIDLGERLDLGAGEVQVRFVAADIISISLVEAALDDVAIEITTGLTIHTVGGRPEVFLLRQNVPNPFHPNTSITFQLKEARDLQLTIYDAAGRLIRRLVDARTSAGDHAVTWDGQNARGFAAPSGVYYYELATPDTRETRRMVLLR
jgi:choice-of-anchor B domain-containing protein